MDIGNVGFWPRFRALANRDYPLWMAGAALIGMAVIAYWY